MTTSTNEIQAHLITEELEPVTVREEEEFNMPPVPKAKYPNKELNITRIKDRSRPVYQGVQYPESPLYIFHPLKVWFNLTSCNNIIDTRMIVLL